MEPDLSGWRVSASYDYVDDLISPDIAWECLRRNRSYQRDYAALSQPTTDIQVLTEQVQHRWGLRFPGTSKSARHRAHGVLEAAGRHKYGLADRNTVHHPC